MRCSCFSFSLWLGAGFGSPMPCSSNAASTTAWRKGGETARRQSRCRRDRRRTASAGTFDARRHSAVEETRNVARVLPDGRMPCRRDRRSSRWPRARRALEAKPQGRLAPNGREYDRAAVAGVRPYQTKGSAPQAQGVTGEADAARRLRRPFRARAPHLESGLHRHRRAQRADPGAARQGQALDLF